jgi:Fe-S-cluster-containing hydrogenase component 2
MIMIHVIAERCPQDHPCPNVKICPVGAISQDRFQAPEIDKEKCIECGECVSYCPYQAFVEGEEKMDSDDRFRPSRI